MEILFIDLLLISWLKVISIWVVSSTSLAPLAGSVLITAILGSLFIIKIKIKAKTTPRTKDI